MRRLLSFILIEAFLFTTLGSELVWARPAFAPQTCLRTPSVANDGASRQDLTDALRTKGPNPAPETQEASEAELREKIARQTFTPIQGGRQVQTIYLSDDLAIYDLPAGQQKSSLKLWLNRRGLSWPMLMQGLIRFLSRYFNGVELGQKVARKGYQLANEVRALIGDLVDPFVILEGISLKTVGGDVVHLQYVAVRERSDLFLHDTLKQLVIEGNLEEAKRRVEEALQLDEALARIGIATLDIQILKNTRLRNGRVVLRDLGSLTQDHEVILFLLSRLRQKEWDFVEHPIETTTSLLREFSPPLAEYYAKRAYEVYSVENFERHWMAQGRTAAARAASVDTTAAKDGGLHEIVRSGIEGYTTLREAYPWQTDVAAGAVIVGLSDWIGQKIAQRSRGVPILKKQIALATAVGGFFGWTYGILYQKIEPFLFWERVGLASIIGGIKGWVYAWMIGKVKVRILPPYLREHYRSRRQLEKLLPIVLLEIPARLLRHMVIQGWVDPFYRQFWSLASNAVIAPIGGWALNRMDPLFASFFRKSKSDEAAKDGGERESDEPIKEWPHHLGSHPSEEELMRASVSYELEGERYSAKTQEILRDNAARFGGFTLFEIKPKSLQRLFRTKRPIDQRKIGALAVAYRQGVRLQPTIIEGVSSSGKLVFLDGNVRAYHAVVNRLPLYAYVGNSIRKEVQRALQGLPPTSQKPKGLDFRRKEGEAFRIGDLRLQVSRLGKEEITLHVEREGEPVTDLHIPLRKLWDSLSEDLKAKGRTGQADPFRIWVEWISDREVYLFIQAQREIPVDREEIYLRRLEEERQAREKETPRDGGKTVYPPKSATNLGGRRRARDGGEEKDVGKVNAPVYDAGIDPLRREPALEELRHPQHKVLSSQSPRGNVANDEPAYAGGSGQSPREAVSKQKRQRFLINLPSYSPAFSGQNQMPSPNATTMANANTDFTPQESLNNKSLANAAATRILKTSIDVLDNNKRLPSDNNGFAISDTSILDPGQPVKVVDSIEPDGGAVYPPKSATNLGGHRRARDGGARGTAAQLKQYLNEHQYPGGPIQMIADAFKQGSRMVILSDPHGNQTHLEDTPYPTFLKVLIERLHREVGLRKVFVEYHPNAVEQELIPMVRENPGVLGQFWDYVRSKHPDQNPLEVARYYLPEHLLPAIQAADEKGLGVFGFDPRHHESFLGEVWLEALPIAGGKTEERFVEEILRHINVSDPDEKVLVIMGTMHAAKAFGRSGELLARKPGLHAKSVFVDVGWSDLGLRRRLWPGRDLRMLLHRSGVPVVAVRPTPLSPIAEYPAFKDWVVSGWTGFPIEGTPQHPVFIRAGNYDMLVYFNDETAMTNYLKTEAARAASPASEAGGAGEPRHGRDGGERSLMTYEEIKATLGQVLGVPLVEFLNPVPGLIRFEPNDHAIQIDPLLIHASIPRILFEKILLPKAKVEKEVARRLQGDTLLTTEERGWTAQILSLQPVLAEIVALSDEEKSILNDWMTVHLRESSREDLISLRRLLSLSEWNAVEDVQRAFVRKWLGEAEHPSLPHKVSEDGGHRFMRYQRSPLQDLSLPGAAPLQPIEKGVEVGSGV